MSFVYKTDYIEEGIGRLLTQFKEKVVIEAIISGLMEQKQDMEDALKSIRDGYNIDLAVGVQLDVLGARVGQAREGRDDDTYRLWIKAKGLINRASGTAEEIYTVLSLLTGQLDAGSFRIIDDYPAKFIIELNDATSDTDAQIIADIIDTMKPVGVGFVLSYSTTAPVAYFDTDGAGFDQGYFTTVIS